MRVAIDGRKIRDFGIGSYIRGLLGGLAQIPSDDEYVVFVPSHARELVPPRFEAIVHDVRTHTPTEMFTLALAIDRARVDLFHAPHYVIPFTGCPTVVTLHDVIHFQFRSRSPIASAYMLTMTRRASEQADRIITGSYAAKADLIETLRADPRKIAVIYHGIDEHYRRDDVTGAAGRYFLYVGNRGPHKNVEGLLDAFRDVHDAKLILAGIPRDAVRVQEGVEVTGFISQEELHALYRGAIAVVMPSFVEGFGLPALEAMACGTPVITSRTPALVEVTGDAALHTNDFAEAMLRVMRDEALRARMRDEGRKRAAEFTWARSAEQTRAVYHSLQSRSE